MISWSGRLSNLCNVQRAWLAAIACKSRHGPLKGCIERCGYTVKPPEAHDLTIQIVNLA
jgi:hypothetical protein